MAGTKEMSEELWLQKTELRGRMRALLGGLPPGRIRERSLGIGASLFASPWWPTAAWVLCFVSLPGEVDTACILKRAWAEGKTVGIPRIGGGGMVFHAYVPGSGPLEVNRFSIREPPPTWPVLAPEDAPGGGLLVVCPGLAFDREGRRLGRGGGYFDRFLSALRAGPESRFTALGVCFREQLLERVPAGPGDQRLDALVWEEGIVTPSGRT